MSGFKISLKELEFLKQAIRNDTSVERIIPDITAAVQLFHNTLERRVHDVYSANGSLTDVMVGKTVKPLEVGKTFLRYGLQYRFKELELSAFTFSIQRVGLQNPAKVPTRSPTGFVRWKQKHWAFEIKVNIRRDKPVLAQNGRRHSLGGFQQGKSIKARSQKATWKVFPSYGVKGVRDRYVTLHGPSFSNMARILYDTDPAMQLARAKFEEDSIAAFTRFYK